MYKTTRIAIAGAVALALGSVVTGSLVPGLVSVAAAADEKPTVSREAGPDLKNAQTALVAKKYDEALAAIGKVLANPKKNAYDEYIANQFAMAAYAAEKKNGDAEKALEAVIASKYLPEGEKGSRINQAFYLNYQLQNYDKALDFGKQLLDSGKADGQTKTFIAQAYYLKNDYKNTAKVVTDLVDTQIKAGETPKEDLLLLGQSSAVKLNDDAALSRWLDKLVTYHPKPEYWQNVLHGLFGTKMPDRQLLQVYRLASDVGALNEPSNYTDMAQLSLDAGSPGEAVAILQKGIDGGVFKTPADLNRNTHLLDTAKKQMEKDQPTLDKAAADANTGDAMVGVGTGYFGYKQYDKAIDNLSKGVAKGGLKDALSAQLLLGVAQYKAGKKSEAVSSFAKVKGDPVMERVATLWSLHAKG